MTAQLDAISAVEMVYDKKRGMVVGSVRRSARRV
jgi:hypothetical protein